jgi:hypothetical protein
MLILERDVNRMDVVLARSVDILGGTLYRALGTVVWMFVSDGLWDSFNQFCTCSNLP